MRLICPNCDAQYEIDSGLIPETGRDVQCSDCGHVWFQVPESALVAAAAPGPGPEQALPPEPQTEPDDPPVDAEDPEPVADPGEQPRRPALDEGMLAILREEAERESRARAEEAARARVRMPEVQSDMALEPAESAPRLRIRPRPAEDAADEAPPPPVGPDSPETAEAQRAPRRDLLPDIDRINSTLAADNPSRAAAGEADAAETVEARRKGFRGGFLTVVVVAALAWTLYVQAPAVVRMVPQVEAAMGAYVALVDRTRLGLDALVRQSLQDAP